MNQTTTLRVIQITHNAIDQAYDMGTRSARFDDNDKVISEFYKELWGEWPVSGEIIRLSRSLVAAVRLAALIGLTAATSDDSSTLALLKVTTESLIRNYATRESDPYQYTRREYSREELDRLARGATQNNE